jgi:hypothetical protein
VALGAGVLAMTGGLIPAMQAFVHVLPLVLQVCMHDIQPWVWLVALNDLLQLAAQVAALFWHCSLQVSAFEDVEEDEPLVLPRVLTATLEIDESTPEPPPPPPLFEPPPAPFALAELPLLLP